MTTETVLIDNNLELIESTPITVGRFRRWNVIRNKKIAYSIHLPHLLPRGQLILADSREIRTCREAENIKQPSLKDVESNLFDWALSRDLLDPQLSHKQALKIAEEVGEIASCVNKAQIDKLALEIGDVFNALTILAYQHDMSITDCAIAAFEKIKDRTGVSINGAWIKDTDL